MQVENPKVVLNTLAAGDTFVADGGQVYGKSNHPPATVGNVVCVLLESFRLDEIWGNNQVTPVAYKAVKA